MGPNAQQFKLGGRMPGRGAVRKPVRKPCFAYCFAYCLHAGLRPQAGPEAQNLDVFSQQQLPRPSNWTKRPKLELGGRMPGRRAVRKPVRKPDFAYCFAYCLHAGLRPEAGPEAQNLDVFSQQRLPRPPNWTKRPKFELGSRMPGRRAVRKPVRKPDFAYCFAYCLHAGLRPKAGPEAQNLNVFFTARYNNCFENSQMEPNA